MTERIEALLKKAEGISDYKINTVNTESYELFFVHRELETVRSTDTTDIKVTVFALHDGKLGDASFSVYSSYSDEKIAEEINCAKKKAMLVSNEVYSLPENETAYIESDSNFASYKPEELGALMAEAVFAADCYEGGSINALEIFIYKDTVSVKNSRGINKTEVKHRAMIEAIPTWNGENESAELYECHNFTEFSFDAVKAEIATKMCEVRDRFYAKKPEEKLSCPVVLAAPELDNLFNEIAYELDFGGVYSRSNAYSKGDAIQKEPTGDKLTITMQGKIKNSPASASFDADGVELRSREIIKDGSAVAYFGNIRYASYLGEEATGALGCLKAECGTMSENELRSRPYFRCASMSGLQVDIYNDYIGGEVRLAYYFDGEREIPVTGISISGKLSECLSEMRLSEEKTVYESYCGPKFAYFSKIEIV